jgi:hypothetical protein
MLPVMMAEPSLALWLLIRGVDVGKWHEMQLTEVN